MAIRTRNISPDEAFAYGGISTIDITFRCEFVKAMMHFQNNKYEFSGMNLDREEGQNTPIAYSNSPGIKNKHKNDKSNRTKFF
jgi:hypothetical protein